MSYDKNNHNTASVHFLSDFLGRTEIQVKEIMKEAGECGRRPIIKHLLLHEVSTGEVVVKLDLHLFDQT